MLVFAGAGAVMVDAKTGALGHVGVAITFGLVIMAGIYAVGHISGAHFNPAVTLAFVLTRHFPPARALGYWCAQLLAAVAAAAVLRGSLGNVAYVAATLPSGSQAQSFLWELVMTAFLIFVIMAVATDTRAFGEAAAIAIGGTIAFEAAVRWPRLGCIHESGAFVRSRARLRKLPRPVGLHRGTRGRRRDRRARVSARAR